MSIRRFAVRVGATVLAFAPVAAFADTTGTGGSTSTGIDLQALGQIFVTQMGNVGAVVALVAPWLISMSAASAVIAYLVGAIRGRASGKI